MTSEAIERVAAWCTRQRLPFERRADSVWLPNPAAPGFGVLIRDIGDATEWSMPFPIPAQPGRVVETERALAWLNQRSAPGEWQLLPDRTVRYRLRVSLEQIARADTQGDAPTTVRTDPMWRSMRAVMDAGNTHVHALVQIMAGREPPEYVETMTGGRGSPSTADDGDRLEPIDERQLVKRNLVFAPISDDDADDDTALTLDRLVRWSEKLCVLPPLDYALAMAELGITGSITPRSRGYATVEPAPPDTRWLALELEHLGANAGSLSGVEVAFTASITRGELDREFGAGDVVPMIDGGGEFETGYRVEIAGAPYRCMVSARFMGVPSDDTPTRSVYLRRDPVRSGHPPEPR